MHSQQARAQAAMGPKRDGPNWVMIAGGAVVMAVGIVIGRKQIQCHGEQSRAGRASRDGTAEFSALIDSRVPSSKGTPCANGVACDSDSPGMKELFDDNFSPDGTSSQLSWKAPRARTYWGDSGTPVSSQPQFELYSSQSKRSHATDSSRPASKQCPRASRDEFQSEVSYSSPALRAGLAARREMVQKLRKQVRSRDGVIFDLQAQVSDQDHAITMLRAHTADLQDRLATTNTELFTANHEIQRLRKELRTQSGKLAVNVDLRKVNDNPEDRKHSMNSEVKAITLEARMLNDKVKRLQGEKQEMESQVQAFSRECEMLFKKASALEAERVQLRKLVNEQGHMLEAKEQECIKLTTALAYFQDNLDIETRDSDWTKSSKLSRPSDALSEISRGTWSDGFDQPVSCYTPDDYYSRSANIGDVDDHRAGDLMRSYNTLFRQSPSRLDNDGSVSKPGSRSTAHGCTSRSACDGSPNYDGPSYDNDENVTLSLVWSLQQEVYQLSDALASRSKAVSQRKLETSRVLTEFQTTQTASLCGPEEHDWTDLSQVLSFSHDGTSVEQLQELSQKLEKVAKQQQVEDEIEALCRHQDQIRALKARLTKLSAKCNAETRKDQPSNESAHRMAGMILDLADKLDVQEDQVRETSMDIHQLSMSLQLSSPYVPRSKKQELQRMLQEGSRQSYSPVIGRALHKDIPISPDFPSAKSCCIAQEQEPDGRSSRFFDRQISFSSLPNKLDAVTGSPEKPPTKLYEFQVGAFDPLSSARTRKSWNPGAGKSSLRKPTVHQSTSSGLKWDTSNEKPNCVQPRSRRVCFSPEEVTSGFSFRPVTSKGVRYPGTEDSAPGRKTSTDIYSYSQPISTFHSQPTPSDHECTGGSSEITPTSDGKFSSAVRIGSPTVSGSAPACFESRDSLRRFLFKLPENSSLAGNATYTGGDSNEDVTFELEVQPSVTTERKSGFVTDDGTSEVQIKRLTEKDSPSVLVTSSNITVRTQQGMRDSGPGCVGVSPFAARMACLDVTKRSTSSFTNSSQGNEAGNQGASLLSEDEDDAGSSRTDSKVVVGKENMRTNELFYSGNQSISRMISSKDNWEESQSMAAKDIFRCDSRRWNSQR